MKPTLPALAALLLCLAVPGVASADPHNHDDNSGGEQVKPISRTCKDSKLEPHDGFQKAPRCVETEMGEVADADNNPTLLIVDAPNKVDKDKGFELKVSTRNLIRDLFPPAAQGGYYLNRSVLKDGITRGHFHTACRRLASDNVAPQPDVVPEAFVATEDGKGGRGADTVTVKIPPLKKSGLYQCASWAGDASHRIPLMERANQTPAFDAVRIKVD